MEWERLGFVYWRTIRLGVGVGRVFQEGDELFRWEISVIGSRGERFLSMFQGQEETLEEAKAEVEDMLDLIDEYE